MLQLPTQALYNLLHSRWRYSTSWSSCMHLLYHNMILWVAECYCPYVASNFYTHVLYYYVYVYMREREYIIQLRLAPNTLAQIRKQRGGTLLQNCISKLYSLTKLWLWHESSDIWWYSTLCILNCGLLTCHLTCMYSLLNFTTYNVALFRNRRLLYNQHLQKFSTVFSILKKP